MGISFTIELLRMAKGLLSANTIAEALGLHPQTLYTWCREGKLPYIRVGSRLKFDGAAVADWLEKRSL